MGDSAEKGSVVLPEAILPAEMALRAGSIEGLTQAGRWFLHSGITEAAGGVARYYQMEPRANARISTEITGYTISSLLDLHDRTGKMIYFAGALKSAAFLCDKAWRDDLQAMPFEWAADGNLPEHHSYFFDCGIITRALVRLWKRNQLTSYMSIAIACGESMRRDFENEADIHPIVALPGKEPVARDARWSRTSDCYQLKSAMAWLDLAEATRDESWAKHYDRCLERSLRTEAEFLTREEGVRVMDRLHSYGYFLEALLPRCEEPEIARVLEAGIGRAAGHLRRVRGEFERADANAQLLRVRLFADHYGAVKLDRESAAEEAAWAAQYQAVSEDPRLNGGYYFGRRGEALAPYANPVSTAFCAQALAMWAEYDGRRQDHWDWRKLV
jgi:hypothetical protein